MYECVPGVVAFELVVVLLQVNVDRGGCVACLPLQQGSEDAPRPYGLVVGIEPAEFLSVGRGCPSRLQTHPCCVVHLSALAFTTYATDTAHSRRSAVERAPTVLGD